jgi:hypothetical protein
LKNAATIRDTTSRAKANTMSVNAAPHARSCAPANGAWAFLKIWTDSAVFGPENGL